MPNDNLYLALDQGGHASRALVFEHRGRTVAQGFSLIATQRHADGRIEHDPEEILGSFRQAMATAASQLEHSADRRQILTAGLATQRSSIVCWDRETGTALSPVISWQDRRNASFVDSLRPLADRIHALTGLVLTPHYGASKLRWCLEHLPQVKAAAASGKLAFGPLSSFIVFRLTNEHAFLVDPANASRTQLWNPATGDWAPELLQLFGIPAECLPRPVESRHSYGTLRFGDLTVPLSICTGDQSAVPFAFGEPQPDTAYVNMGTGAFIQRPLPQPVISPPLLSSIVWSEAGTSTWVLEGTVNGAGSALDWFAQQTGADIKQGLAQLESEPARIIGPPLFVNGISGLGSPFWVPELHSHFVEHSAKKSAIDAQLAAVLESILFLIRVNLDEMQRYGPPLGQIAIAGGLAAADFLCRSLASLTNLPVRRYAEREATARGLAFLLADRPAHWPVGHSQVFEPQVDTALLERFFAWLKAMKQAIKDWPSGMSH